MSVLNRDPGVNQEPRMSSEPRNTSCWEHRFDLASCRAEIDEVVGEVLQACRDQGFEEPATFAIRLSLEEAMANAMTHGNAGGRGQADPSGMSHRL